MIHAEYLGVLLFGFRVNGFCLSCTAGLGFTKGLKFRQFFCLDKS